jgi:NAD(P)-dependent dehydrogenase (short-subunit alcohol dehydrogenase family)
MKHAFVTGASRGLGLSFVNYLSTQGYIVFAGMRNTQDFRPVSENIIPVSIDVSSDESIFQACERVREKLPLSAC